MNYKTITLALFATLAFASCKKEVEANTVQEQENATPQTVAPAVSEEATEVDPNAKFSAMEFPYLEYDFGNITQEKGVETIFKFTNTGEADLVISNATGSCGCTVPDYPKQPIAPGETGEIKVSFSPKGRNGSQFKTVSLTTNTQKGTEILHIKANIIK
jgi:hypothetical protein